MRMKQLFLVMVMALLAANFLDAVEKRVLHMQSALGQKRSYQEMTDEFRNDPQRFQSRAGRVNTIDPFLTDYITTRSAEHQLRDRQQSIAKEADGASRAFSANKFWLDAASRRAGGFVLPDDIASIMAIPAPSDGRAEKMATSCAEDPTQLLCLDEEL